MEREHSGAIGWGVLAAGVAAWDIYAPETLTSAFKRGTENPRSRPFVLAGLGVTALHLLSLIPREIDPFYMSIDRTPLRHRDIDKGDTI